MLYIIQVVCDMVVLMQRSDSKTVC